MDADEAAAAVVTAELESLADHQAPSSSSSSPSSFSLSDASVAALRVLLAGSDHDSSIPSRLAAFNLSPSSIVLPLSATLDSSPEPLPAADALISLLIAVSSLSSPVALLSLFRALRRSFKSSSSHDPDPRGSFPNSRRRKPSSSRNPNAAPPRLPDPSSSSPTFSNVFGSLERVLPLIRLDCSPDCLKSLIDTVAFVFAAGRHEAACLRIFVALISGDQASSSAVEVFKSLSPVILSSAKSPSRASALAFVTTKAAPLSRDEETIRQALVYLPRFLALKAPERSEPRALAVESITAVVKAMEWEEDQIGFAEFVMKMATGKTNLRLLAVDLILALLISLPDPLDNEKGCRLISIGCLDALVSRCSDSAGGVRARALANLAQLVGLFSGEKAYLDKLKQVVGDSGFVDLLRQRCADDKAAVRKAALVLVAKVPVLLGGHFDEELLRAVGSACSDPLVSIRKAAVAALSEVVRRSMDSKVIDEWLHSVPCLIMDSESSLQEECENLFLELVLDKVSRAGNRRRGDDVASLDSEGVLDLLKGICDGEVMPCVKKICASLGKKKKLMFSVVTSLQNIIKISESAWRRSSMPIEKWVAPAGAWQLLSEVSLFLPKEVDWKFLQHHWELLDKHNAEEESIAATDELRPDSMSWAGCRVALLQTISNVSVELPAEPAAELAHKLLIKIEQFDMHSSEVDAHVKALAILCKRKTPNPKEGDIIVSKWVHQLLIKAQDVLNTYLLEASNDGKAANRFRTPLSRKTMGTRGATAEARRLLPAVTAVFTIGSLALVCPSADLQGIIPLLQTIITSGSSETRTKELEGLPFSMMDSAPSLYINSWVTMGKICLADDKLAKRYIPLFVQELEQSSCAALRNNIMVVMADFCVRHTALVDCYIPKITSSLCDPCEVVRRQSFIFLSRLLQRDYVKWRGSLFLRFLLCLVDDSEKIRRLADFLFGNILKVKAPFLAYNSFVEAIFVLNDCNAHAGHSEARAGQKKGGPSIFSIRGSDERSMSRRMHVYASLLKLMAPEHLLATSAKLCAEILAAASDGLLDVDDATGLSVLQDALKILSCKEMRLHHSQSGSDSSADMDDEAADGALLAAARGRVVTHVAKKNLIQTAVPIFIELKRVLESKNSPAIGCLMECLCVLLKDYKSEFQEILVADKQLQKELLYDMQKYEAAAKAKPAAAAASGGNAGTEDRRPVPAAAARLASDTPPLRSLSLPKLKTNSGADGASRGNKSAEVLESLRRRPSFVSGQEG